jgi:hypothetical protein
MEWYFSWVEGGDLNCVEKPSIYREMRGKKKTMKEIKKEKEGKWNLSGRYKERKEMVSGMVELKLTI